MSTDKKKRGFAVISLEKRRAIASLGGRAAHAQGKAHCWNSQEAAAAGRKGGKSRRRQSPAVLPFPPAQ